MNPTLKSSTDKLGITLLIIKHGEDMQPRAVSWQSHKDTGLTTILETIIIKQQFLKKYLIKHKMYCRRSINNTPQQDHNYDTKSRLILIDNHASASMINGKTDFIDTQKQANIPIKGTKGHFQPQK
jgi:hypothetical protein